MTPNEEQLANREKPIMGVQAAIELKSISEKSRFISYCAILAGSFTLVGSILFPGFEKIIGLTLIAGGIWTSKQETDYLNYLKEKYGV